MTRMTVFSSPLLLGFDQLEQLLEQATKAGDGYPPYNIERLLQSDTGGENWQITLAVAGFAAADLEVTVDGNTRVEDIRSHHHLFAFEADLASTAAGGVANVEYTQEDAIAVIDGAM